MSYEHCDKHNEPATNGCESCYREEVNAQKQGIADMLKKMFTRWQAMDVERTLDELEIEYMKLAEIRLLYKGSVWP